ncbi:MAG: methyl-accepting chemotaxis protein [Treponemataceae bacterium]|nr:methyl-accepting chemotaxis protein [Treponemataceae bacterium]
MKIIDRLSPNDEILNKFDYQTQKRISNLISGDIICFSLFVLLSIAMFVTKINFLSSCVISVTAVLFFTSLIFIRKGHVFIGSFLTTIALLLGSINIAFFSHTSTELVHYRTTCFMVVMATVNTLVSLKIVQLHIFHGVSYAILIGSFFTTYLETFMQDKGASITALIINILALALANLILLASNVISTKLIKHAENQQKQVSENLNTITNVLTKANESLNIGHQLNQAANMASKSSTEINELYKNLIIDTEHLRSETESVKHAGCMITDSTSAMSRAIQEQNSAIVETTTAMTEISTNVTNINGIAQKRHQNLNAIATLLDNQTELVYELVKQVEQVKESSNEIAKFVQTVDSIAGQTNLLAMNASIEAAHAGAMGKGFGVIAQEIRKLSEETTRNANKIADTLKSNTEIVKETSESVAAFASSTTNSSDEIRNTLKSVGEIIDGLSEIQIATHEIAESFKLIVDKSQENEDTINNVVGQIDIQGENLNNISNLTNGLNQRVDDINTKLENINNAIDVIYNGAKENEKVSERIASLLH